MKTILIFGTGSIAMQHRSIIKKIYKNPKIFFFSGRRSNKYLNNQNFIKDLNPDFIIIASKTSDHYHHLILIEKFFKNKLILIEKPLFDREIKKKLKFKNKIIINYNLRFHNIIKKIKEIINPKKVFSVYISCMSYLPKWRNNRNYKFSYSSSKKNGGGVALDLSHEIDYAQYLFGKINKVNNSFSDKISNLEVDSDDVLFFSCKQKSINTFFYLDYFTKINKREIIINEKNKTIVCDLINSKIVIKDKFRSKNKLIRLTSKKNHSLENVHYNIKKGIFSNFCTYEEGYQIVKLIKLLKNK